MSTLDIIPKVMVGWGEGGKTMQVENTDPAILEDWHRRINALERAYDATMVWQLVRAIKACAPHLLLPQTVEFMEQLLPLAKRWGWDLIEMVTHTYGPPSLSASAAPDPDLVAKLWKTVDGLERWSVRMYNCLVNAGFRYIGELVQKTDSEMLKTKNFGRKELAELKSVLASMGLNLGMKLEPNVWPGSGPPKQP